jgi:hypothetical protein
MPPKSLQEAVADQLEAHRAKPRGQSGTVAFAAYFTNRAAQLDAQAERARADQTWFLSLPARDQYTIRQWMDYKANQAKAGAA